MHYSPPARTPIGRIRIRVAGLLVVLAAITAAFGHQLRASSPSSSTTASHTHVLRSKHRGAPGKPGGVVPRSEHRGPIGEVDGAFLRSDHGDALGEADGAVRYGTTVFADELPAVANLDPALHAALRQAATEAAADGVEFVVDSGWRSPEYQEQLLREAVSKYGSETEALRWVATPNRSAHVKGDAVDIGPLGAGWLSAHGATYGLCQVYDNEPWHYELRPQAIDHGCPPMYADPAQDPRMQQ